MDSDLIVGIIIRILFGAFFIISGMAAVDYFKISIRSFGNNDEDDPMAECDVCGRMISKRAEFCPGCGQQYRIQRTQAPFLGLIVSLVFFILSGVFGYAAVMLHTF
ncbi:zinc ribbon domain-containing protein [Paenibacillus apis]|uniref:Zinc ribbon domain-containing protein n=1 Tax=Paenibacillus apis TaxID=1792174 RepID=A0A919Y4J0_9BACL|nr:zinc ribbon domain-containing protein [Paenibacillus apis]GIO43163.1 hypothetical protein J41TS4_29210 [Paenibacillus apis]